MPGGPSRKSWDFGRKTARPSAIESAAFISVTRYRTERRLLKTEALPMKSIAAIAVLITTGVVFACSGEPEAPYVPPSTGGTGGASPTGGSAGVGTGGSL